MGGLLEDKDNGVAWRDVTRQAAWLLTSNPTQPHHTLSFGICLVPQASEDKFDCYKCHWREGEMCEYGICE